MPKQKTHKGLTKRVKITASGKVMRRRAGKSHLLSKKNAKHRRRLSTSAALNSTMARKIKAKILN